MTTVTKAQRIDAIKAKMKAHCITRKMAAERSGYDRDSVNDMLRSGNISEFALCAIEGAADQLAKAGAPLVTKQTSASGMAGTAHTMMIVMHHFKTNQVLFARDLSQLMFEADRDIGLRQCQRLLQKMCDVGFLLQARRADTAMPIQYMLSPTARELMTGGAA